MTAARDLTARGGTFSADRSRSVRGPIRVVLVIGVRLYRDGLAGAFKRVPTFDLVATGASVADAPHLVRAHPADVAVLDLDEHDGPSIVHAVRAAQRGIRVVVLGIEELAEHVVPLLEAGAAGYVTRDASLQELLDVVHRAARGEAL